MSSSLGHLHSEPKDFDDLSQLTSFRDVLRTSKHIIVIAGAGLSAASGIPTFRDGGGIWRSLDATSLATPEAFASNPSLVWQFYHYRRVKALEAEPNDAHKILAKLSVPSYLKKVAPTAKTFHLITQNVDRLSIRALDALSRDLADRSARSERPRMDSVIQMHGKLFEVQCTKCEHRVEDLSDPLCPSLDTSQLDNYTAAGSTQADIPEEALPRCTACGALARPGVVWFDEIPYGLDEINTMVFKADLCLVVGTSSTVRPASTYAYRVKRHKGKVAIFNLNPSAGDERADFIFRGPCETELARAFPELA